MLERDGQNILISLSGIQYLSEKSIMTYNVKDTPFQFHSVDYAAYASAISHKLFVHILYFKKTVTTVNQVLAETGQTNIKLMTYVSVGD